MKRVSAVAFLLTAACASGTTEAPAPEPQPVNREPAPAAPTGAGVTTEREGDGRALMLDPHPHAAIVVRRVDTVAMELPAGSQVQAFERTAYISSVAERSGDDYAMTFVLDSVVAGAASFLPADSIEAARGTRWTGRLLPDGQLVDLKMDTTRGRPRTGVGDQTTRTLEVLYPVLPEDGVRAGAAWSDSVDTQIETGGFSVNERGVIRYTAVERGGALELTGRGTLRHEGSGSQFGQELEMTGEGTRAITYRLDRGGRLVGASGTDGAALEIIVPAMGQTVPLTQNSTFEITVAPR